MSQWNRILKVAAKLDFETFTRISYPGDGPEGVPCDSVVLLPPDEIISEGLLENWHLFPAVYDEKDLRFRIPADSCCGKWSPENRLVEAGSATGSLYLEDARIFFAVLQNKGLNICGECLGTLYADSHNEGAPELHIVDETIDGLKL